MSQNKLYMIETRTYMDLSGKTNYNKIKLIFLDDKSLVPKLVIKNLKR